MSKGITTVELDITVECGECGDYLGSEFSRGVLTVDLCSKCTAANRDEAAKEARDEAEAAS